MTMNADDDRLADRMRIQEVMYRYARAVDRRDWERMREAFHPDALDHHGPYRGPVGPFIELLKQRHVGIATSMHMITNCLIDFFGPDIAAVESYFTTFQRLTPAAGDYRKAFLRGGHVGDDQDLEVQVCGRYVDKFTRRDGRWRIATRQVVYEVYRGQPAPPGGGLNPDWILSRRDGNDPMEVQLRALAAQP